MLLLSKIHKDKKDKHFLEVKIGIDYIGKEARYSTGKFKKLKDKLS